MPKILNAECKSAGPRVSQAGAGTDMGQSRTEERRKNVNHCFINRFSGF